MSETTTPSTTLTVEIVEPIHSRDGRHTGYIFKDGQQPPRYALVDVGSYPSGTKWTLRGIGPLLREQIDHSKEFWAWNGYDLQSQPIPDDSQPYTVIAHGIDISDAYPGGHEAAALLVARFILEPQLIV